MVADADLYGKGFGLYGENAVQFELGTAGKPQMRVGYVIAIVLCFSISGNSSAEAVSYTCHVGHVYSLSKNGILEPSQIEKEMQGSSFSVSRTTGEITGKVIPTLLARSTRVVNRGSKENSFKAIADFDENFQILEIQEFRSSSVKPFVALSMGGAGVVTGTCK